MKKFIFTLYIFLFCTIISTFGQQQDQTVEQRLQDYFAHYKGTYVQPQLSSFKLDYDKRTLTIYTSEAFGFQPFRPESVDNIYSQLKAILPGPVCFFNISVYCDGKPIEELIPNYYRKHLKKDPDRLEADLNYKGSPWIKNISVPYTISHGLQDRYISLWQSHGRYYSDNGWTWQRPRLFCTTEDLFTQSFVIPFLIPMLEHAGATVITPRERDIQRHEIIVDNDTQRNTSMFVEKDSKHNHWQTAPGKGFVELKKKYNNGENPFTMGTARYINAENKPDRAFTEWIPNIPESGKYGVYISYKTFPNSINDAHYVVYHKGQATEFHINQQMGGGTWVYLGTFDFDRGINSYDAVTLSNKSDCNGVVSADAVRFGGGMGNIVRGTVSGLPRYLEGARYSAQWAGMPVEVYDGRKGTDDYADDINVRSLMTNYFSGGSIYNPNKEGLKVPIEITMALHSDAGSSATNDFIGSLGVYTTQYNNGTLNAGTDRYASRDLCDVVLTEIKREIDETFGVKWQRRGMWNRNYSESRIPAVPSTIIEMLSHQNFADIKLGHDPHFKFAVSRAIYKGILRFITSQHKDNYIVQPLPVSHFAIQYGKKKNTLSLSWQGENDPLEPTANPRSYIIYQREDSGSFDNGTEVNNSSYMLKVEPGKIYSFYVTAVNHGGESFPSETLSAMRIKHEKGRVLIVNGFNRLSAPYIVDTPDSLGFDLDKDPGVAYGNNISLCGRQVCFDRKQVGKEGPGSLGYSTGELEGKIIAGNSFDYPFIHGKAIQETGKWGFTSCSRESFEELINEGEALISPEEMKQLYKYQCIDLILGLQKQDNSSNSLYKSLSERMKGVIHSYCISGGNLIISGSYVGSDMYKSTADKTFCSQVLKYGYVRSLCENDSLSLIKGNRMSFCIPRKMNEKIYAVTKPDILTSYSTSLPLLRYNNGGIAAIFYNGKDYRTCVMGFPFESITDEQARNSLMTLLLRIFEEKR